MKPFIAWIAVSAQGHPAPFIGYSFQRQFLRATYRTTFGHDLETVRYRTVKVRISETPSAQKTTVRPRGSKGVRNTTG